MATSSLTDVAIDIGGTFTDVVGHWSDGTVRTTKFLSSESLDPVHLAARLAGWVQAAPEGRAPAGVHEAHVVHGTTVTTNALLAGKVATTALITTNGFRDVLELGRGIRSDPVDLSWRPLPPLVPRHLRFVVNERIGARGEVVRPLEWSEAEQQRLLDACAGCDAIAIALINAHANPAHEQAVAALFRKRAPRHFVTASHEINPEAREYERTSTTVVNAVLGPIVEGYLGRLEEALRRAGFSGKLDVMQSSGGTISSAMAKRRPVTMVESGPAAGVLATAAIANTIGAHRVIAFDMGGTTAKASLIEDCEVLESPEYYVGGGVHAGARTTARSGYVIRFPSVDVAEVGAGGGSIAAVDEAGGLQVGPQSAGAAPGPACYALGGDRATVTDANVILGYISPRAIAGGLQGIDLERARAAVQSDVAVPLGLSVEDAALLVHAGANARILSALRAVTIERGRDPREHILVAFGGSGPVHAAGIADLMGISRVLVPSGAGVFSAAGLMAAGRAGDVIDAYQCSLEQLDTIELARHFDVLRARLVEAYHASAAAVAAAQPLVAVRYVGQNNEIYVPFTFGPDATQRVRRGFEDAYLREFGFLIEGGPCEVTALRLRLRQSAPERWEQVLSGLGAAWNAADSGTRQERPCVFSDYRGPCRVQPVSVLGGGEAVLGPVILETADTTIVVPPGWTATRRQGIGVFLCR